MSKNKRTTKKQPLNPFGSVLQMTQSELIGYLRLTPESALTDDDLLKSYWWRYLYHSPVRKTARP